MTHYFTGAVPGDVSPGLAAEPIWVNLTMERQVLSLTVRSIGPAPNAPVTVSSSAGSVVATPGQTFTVTRNNNGNCRVDAPGGTFTGPCTIDAEWDGFSGSPTAGVILDGCTLMNWNLISGGQSQPCTYARGGLRIRPDNNTNTVNLSVEIDMEDYILGVSEMPSFWSGSGGMAALEAQAVAARSYAYSKIIARAAPENRPWCWCSIYDTTVDQSYVGWGHGTQAWIDAVSNTEGKVMTHPSATSGGQLIPIPTYYSSSTFGWTENSEHGFSSFVPYLRSVDDHWSQLPDVGNSNARWTRQFTGSQLASRLPGMSTVTDLAITKCSTTGAALEITFYGSGGPRVYKTRDLRGLLSLKSMQVFNVGSPTPGAPPCTGSGGGSPPPTSGPVVFVSASLDDDNLGDSFGNDDGLADCGETIEMLTTVRNEGSRLTGVRMAVATGHPSVTVRWNGTATAANAPAGGTTTNNDDWDLKIAPDAPAGLQTVVTVTVTAKEGGPWVIEVPLTVHCDRDVPGAATGIPDANGDGVEDLGIVYTDQNGMLRFVVKSGANGTQISSGTVGNGLEPVAITVVRHFGGSFAAELAILVGDSATGQARVLVFDSGTGAKLSTLRLGNKPAKGLQVHSLPSFGGSPADEIAVLIRRENGRTALLTVDAATGERVASNGFNAKNDVLTFVVAADSGRTAADDYAVLMVRANGRVRVVVADAKNGKTISTLHLSSRVTPVGVASASGFLAVVGTRDGSIIVATASSKRFIAGSEVVDVTVSDGELLLLVRDGSIARVARFEGLQAVESSEFPGIRALALVVVEGRAGVLHDGGGSASVTFAHAEYSA
jgi:SpoIID/LytB domain protein